MQILSPIYKFLVAPTAEMSRLLLCDIPDFPRSHYVILATLPSRLPSTNKLVRVPAHPELFLLPMPLCKLSPSLAAYTALSDPSFLLLICKSQLSFSLLEIFPGAPSLGYRPLFVHIHHGPHRILFLFSSSPLP